MTRLFSPGRFVLAIHETNGCIHVEMDRCPALWQLEDNYGRFLRIIVSHGTFWAPKSDDGLALGGTSAVPRRHDLYSSSSHRPLVMDDR